MTEIATQDEQPVVIEDSEADREKMEQLEARMAETGIEPGEPDPATRGLGSAQSMVAEARQHLGYREKGHNDTKFNRWLGAIKDPAYEPDGFGYPWCHSFVSYCLWHSDNAGAGPKTAGCLSGVGWFKQQGRFSNEPHVGDLVYYGAGGGTHVELVVGVSSNSLQTIGGNTSGSVDGKTFFNGDGVYKKTVIRTSRIFGYGHPAYSVGGASAGKGGGTTDSAVKPFTNVRNIRQQQEAVNSLGRKPPLDVDGEWGPETEKGVKWLQKRIGAAEVDGQWGQETERLFKAFS